MGLSWSKRRRQRHDHHHDQQLQQQQQQQQIIPSPPTSTSSSNPPPPLNPPPPTPTPSQQPPPPPGCNPASYAFAANAPHPTDYRHPYPYAPPPPPPPPLPPPYNYNYNYSGYFPRPVNMMGHYNYRPPYYVPQITGWGPSVAPYPPPPQLMPPVQPAPYVDHQSAKKIKNDVNVHKDTIKLQLDDLTPDCHLVTFTFDAMLDGRITIMYFAKEGENCKFTPVYPEIVPVKIPFQKGPGQKFCQPSGTGVDLGFFDTDDLSKPSPREDIYPLVIIAESFESSTSADEGSEDDASPHAPHAQITQAVLEKRGDKNFQVKVIKQILSIDGARYELREIFGISDSNEATISNVESGKECIICLTEDKNTAVLPCRHMCLCSDCAKELRIQSNKCPVCRQPIEELLEIKVDEGNTSFSMSNTTSHGTTSH